MNLTNTAKSLIELSAKATGKSDSIANPDPEVLDLLEACDPQTIASICKRLLELEDESGMLDFMLKGYVILSAGEGRFFCASPKGKTECFSTQREAILNAMAQEKLR